MTIVRCTVHGQFMNGPYHYDNDHPDPKNTLKYHVVLSEIPSHGPRDISTESSAQDCVPIYSP